MGSNFLRLSSRFGLLFFFFCLLLWLQSHWCKVIMWKMCNTHALKMKTNIKLKRTKRIWAAFFLQLNFLLFSAFFSRSLRYCAQFGWVLIIAVFKWFMTVWNYLLDSNDSIRYDGSLDYLVVAWIDYIISYMLLSIDVHFLSIIFSCKSFLQHQIT